MAYKKTSKKQEAEWKQVEGVDGIRVIGDESRFSISIEIEEGFTIGINGCRVAEGSKGKFISFPSWKDNSGNYHRYAFATFDDYVVDKIIAAL